MNRERVKEVERLVADLRRGVRPCKAEELANTLAELLEQMQEARHTAKQWRSTANHMWGDWDQFPWEQSK